jgi:hypothetical protein
LNSSGTLKSMETAAGVSRFTSFMMSFLNDGIRLFFYKYSKPKKIGKFK